MSKITVDQNKCLACGSCYSMYPECFVAGTDGKSYVKDHDYKKYGYSKEDIISVCPSEAITIED